MTLATARKILTVFGVIYLLIGVLGFVPPLVVPTAVPGQGLLLGIFAVNALHNVAHLVLGALMVVAGTADSRFRMLTPVLAAIFVVLVIGSIIAPIVEAVAINVPDTILHLVSALLLGYLAFGTPQARLSSAR
ncbi:MAG: DUF4383 domain-containing protein [Chloroflexi bacterium]|nr:DUF4383 domain-containing protein [Chloroflexota bacterium]